jgi:hypothetical protein
MVHPIYHQRIGNPIQKGRLPQSRPTIERLVADDLAATAHTIRILLFLTVAGAIAVIFSIRMLHAIPSLFLLVPAAASGGYLGYQFARHYAFVCTTYPLERPVADVLRRRWSVRAGLSALLPGCAALPLLLWPTGDLGSYLIFGLPFLAGTALILAPYVLRPGVFFSAQGDAFVSWFTYNRRELYLPGLLESPVGTASGRTSLAALAVVANAVLLAVLTVERFRAGVVDATLFGHAGMMLNEPVKVLVHYGLRIAAILMAPVMLTLAECVAISGSVVPDARAVKSLMSRRETWDDLVEQTQNSEDEIEQVSYPLGVNDYDGSPVQVPLEVLTHAWILGDTGSGKTSMALAPLLEWLILFGRYSVIYIDLKGDDLAMFLSLLIATERARRRHGLPIPLGWFTNVLGVPTYAFNALNQSNRSQLSLYQLVDLQCAALGCTYGVEYGEGWYSSANAEVLHQTLKKFPNVRSYRELAERVGYMIVNAKREELHNEIRKAGLHVKTVLERLADLEALNVSDSGDYSPSVLEHAIDFSGPRSVFTEPQSYYFHCSTALGPTSAAAIARLVVHTLLTAARTTRNRTTPVFVVIDEFQRMATSSLEHILQQARSMGITVILANQSMQDVRNSRIDLIPVLEANCRFRQWFSVSNLEDQERLAGLSGQYVDQIISTSRQSGPNGVTHGIQRQQVLLNRLSANAIRLASDHPQKSIVQITRGSGYAQYGGFPFVVRSDYHISEEEYGRRRTAQWPAAREGTITPSLTPAVESPAVEEERGPVISSEVVQRPSARRSRSRRRNQRSDP